MKLPQISPRRDFFKTNIHTQINDIILTLEECIFTPYSSQRRAVSSKLRSASAGDWPLKIKLNNLVNNSQASIYSTGNLLKVFYLKIYTFLLLLSSFPGC